MCVYIYTVTMRKYLCRCTRRMPSDILPLTRYTNTHFYPQVRTGEVVAGLVEAAAAVDGVSAM